MEKGASGQRRIPWGRVGLGVGAAAAVTALVWAWIPPAVPVETAAVARGTLVTEVREDGFTRVIDRYVISAPLAGSLARLDLRPGDPVGAGDVVARLLPTEAPLLDVRSRADAEARAAAAEDARKVAAANVTVAEQASANADRDLARIQALGDTASAQTVDRARGQAAMMRAQLASARYSLGVAAHQAEAAQALLQSGGQPTGDEVDLTAPEAGTVLRVFQESAAVVGPGTAVLEVGDPDALEVVVDVLSADAVRIEPLAQARIEGWGGAPLGGRVYRVEPAAFTRISALGIEEQRVHVVVRLDGPPEAWRGLGDGYRVEARIELDRADDVPKIPESALFRTQGKTAVFVERGGRARLAPVEVGLRNGTEAEIVGGLSEGARVVVHPSDAVRDGIRIRDLSE